MMKVSIAYAEDLYNGGAKREAQAVTNQIDGGDCPHCSKPYELVKVDNKLALGQYYRPTCRCEEPFPKLQQPLSWSCQNPRCSNMIKGTYREYFGEDRRKTCGHCGRKSATGRGRAS